MVPLFGDRLDRTRPARWLGLMLGLSAGLSLLAMMLLTVVDVFGRDALAAPVPGAFELTELLMVGVIFSALPLVTAVDGHVTIDMIDVVMPARVRPWHRMCVDGFSAIVVAIIAWQLWIKAGVLTAYGEITLILEIPMGPFTYAMALLTAVTAIILFGSAARWARTPNAS